MGEEALKNRNAAGLKSPDPQALAEMLEDREKRWEKRMELAKTAPSLLSLTLCVPLPFRCEEAGKKLLRDSAAQLIEMLKNGGFKPAEAVFLDGADGLAVFVPCRKDAESLKRFCVAQEENLPKGRILDMDVTKQGGEPVGRAELKLPPRKCFLCGRPAAECVAATRHTPAEVAEFVEKMLQ